MNRNRLAHNPLYIALSHASYRWMSRISPLWNSKRRFLKVFHRPLNLEHPVTWSEKLMVLKLRYYNDSPLVRRCANKYLARGYVKEKGCEELLLPCYGVWQDVDSIPFGALPENSILKCTMGCGMQMHVFVHDPFALDVKKARKTLNDALHDKYYLDYAEMQYAPGRDMHPEILCEKLVDTPEGREADDFKFFCFHGEPKYVLYCYDRDREGHASYMFLDMDWVPHPELHPCMRLDDPPKKPVSFSAMISYARKLSAPFPFVRVDFYEERGEPRFGELTFTPSACLDAEITEAGQRTLGALLCLKRVNAAALT